MEAKKPKQRKKALRIRHFRKQGSRLHVSKASNRPLRIKGTKSVAGEEFRRITRSQDTTRAFEFGSPTPSHQPLPSADDSLSSGEDEEVVFQATSHKHPSNSSDKREHDGAAPQQQPGKRGLQSEAGTRSDYINKIGEELSSETKSDRARNNINRTDGEWNSSQDKTMIVDHEPSIQIPSNNHSKEGKDPRSRTHDKEGNEDSIQTLKAKNDIIIQTLEKMNGRLQKLDTLESLNLNLQGEVAHVRTRIDEVSNSLDSVKQDLLKHEEKWNEVAKGLSDRIASVEKNSKSLEKKWELHRESVANDFKILQSSIDSNSKQVLEIEASVDKYKGKWDSLNTLEDQIKKAAEKKFNAIKTAVKIEIGEEILEEVRAKPQEVSREDLEELREEMAEKVEKLQSQSKVLPEEIKEEIREEVCLDQAFSKRLNLVIFGLGDNDSSQEDLTKVKTLFASQMGLHNLKIHVTYRLGQYRPQSYSTRPLVVQFSDIRDRWRVWNSKSKIKHDPNSPVRIQEDLPKKLREGLRVLHRIAKVANQRPEIYGDVRVKDYRLNINGNKYGVKDVGKLPPELHPEYVYTPRNSEAVIFFTKQSPFSNHFASAFEIDDHKFSCIEQYLAFAKARLAKNKAMEKKALEQTDPAECKIILNSLREEIQEMWEAEAPAIILPAVRAKFFQNEKLADFLVETYPLTIGEASRDAIWGTGLTLEHKDALDVTRWEHRGNLLGYTLEQVREEIITSYRENTQVHYPARRGNSTSTHSTRNTANE